MLGSRSTTPSTPQCIYLTVAATLPREGLLPRLVSRLREYGGEAVSCGPDLDRLVREEVGVADAVGGAAAARRLSAIDGAELVVAEISEADATVAAEVMYALHRRRVPTLCLWRRECESAFTASLTGDAAHPLLTTGVYSDEAEAEALIDAFAAPPEMPGRIFVVEGGDGAGKQTQSALLRERLRAEGYPVSTLDYPHDAALHGKLIRTLLSGAKGDIKALNPLLFASLYAQNRADTAPLLSAWLRRGHNVILDRYVEANFGHQASKLPEAERPDLIRQLTAFEHDWLDLPRAHRVVYLDLPPEVAARAMAADGTRAALDIHETAGEGYKRSVRETFLWCAEHYEHWVRVPCVADDGTRHSKSALSEVLYASLASEFVNRQPPAAQAKDA